MGRRRCRSSDSTKIISFLSVMLALSRFSVARAWLAAPLRLALQNQQRIQHTSTVVFSQKWKVGDDVLVPREKGSLETIKGRIKEKRGSGWYEVALEENDRVIKCRGTQLRNLTAATQKGVVVETSPGPVAASLVQPILKSAAGGLVGVAPPPPTIFDLDAAIQQHASDPVKATKDQLYLAQVAHHMSYRKWVVFTDLHCSPSTLDTTLQVLDHVHKLARERGAGVLFLGDWWHHRGSIRVDCLNAVLDGLKTWTVPMVMIPGNHDQVTLGGHNHGLTPLENAYRVYPSEESSSASETYFSKGSFPGPLVFSHPTKFSNALFIPHIRHNAVMESVLQSKQANDAAALFIHADVTGAYMNDLIRSLGGVPPSMFPENKPIYSGHFHKPHVVETKRRDVSIEYLGSPYQVSLSEAQQEKSLAVLDSEEGWKCIERIPLDIGRKHFRVNSLEEFLEMKPPSILDPTSEISEGLRADNRVVLSLDKQWLDDFRFSSTPGDGNELESHAEALRAAGVTVEVREVRNTEVKPIADPAESRTMVEDMSLESTWKAYLAEEMRRDAMTEKTAEGLRKPGLEILTELETDREEPLPESNRGPTELNFQSVSIEGFGPFRDRVTYPLCGRGLVLLRGINTDGGSDSNGSGKTSLAVSTLWALTGTIDSRPLSDNKVADVVNESCKTARAIVQGTLNGVEFSITRTKTKSRGSLIFVFDGEDISTQSVKETQQLIDEMLGISPLVLSRTLFHGQHALNGLLEATDTKFKDELSLVVPLEKWQEATAKARKLARDANKRVSEIDGMVAVRSSDSKEATDRLEKQTIAMKERESTFEELRLSREEELRQLSEQSEIDGVENYESIGSLEARLGVLEADLMQLMADQKDKEEAKEKELKPLQNSLLELEIEIEKTATGVTNLRREFDDLTLQVQNADTNIKKLQTMWEVDLSSGVPAGFRLPINCPTCKQAISEEGAGHGHKDLEASVLSEMRTSVGALHEAKVLAEDAAVTLSAAEQTKSQLEAEFTAASQELNERSLYYERVILQFKETAENKRDEQMRVSTKIGEAARQLQQGSRIKSLEMELKGEEEKLQLSREAFENAREEVRTLEAKLADLRKEKDEQARVSLTMSSLTQAFAQKGVQTFLLQNAVSSLEAATQGYLTEMSDGAQRLELTLDSGDGIVRRALVRGKGGEFMERPLGSLSGGQWRRCSLALNFGFADLVARRGQFRSSLCILDEPLTHLDQVGRRDVGRVVRSLLRPATGTGSLGLSYSTVLIILQDLAAEELEEAFDCIDEVVKRDGVSSIVVDGAED